MSAHAADALVRVKPDPLDELIRKHPVASLRAVSIPIVLLLAGLLVWGYYAVLDEVAIARGEVIPQSKVKVVQHLEGGIVQSIRVVEGAQVGADDPLLQLELAPSNMNREEIHIRLDALVLSMARMKAEATGQPLSFPAEEARRRPDLVRAERNAFESRQQEFASAMSGLNEQMRQREAAFREFQATRTARVNDLRLTREKLKISQSLVGDNLVSRIDHIQLERDVERLVGEVAILDQSIPRAAAAVAEGRDKIREEQSKFRRTALEAVAQTEANIQRTRELLSDASGQARRTEIRSPIDGVVKNMKFTTIGGVIRPGEPIMEIVPLDDTLVIEAKLNPVDRGYVSVGQRAVVKISTYDFVRYGGLEGTVVQIAADANQEQNGSSYFKMVIETEKSYLGDRPGDYPISPGMQALVDVHTGRKSVLEYLIRPVLKLRHEAFRER